MSVSRLGPGHPPRPRRTRPPRHGAGTLAGEGGREGVAGDAADDVAGEGAVGDDLVEAVEDLGAKEGGGGGAVVGVVGVVAGVPKPSKRPTVWAPRLRTTMGVAARSRGPGGGGGVS